MCHYQSVIFLGLHLTFMKLPGKFWSMPISKCDIHRLPLNLDEIGLGNQHLQRYCLNATTQCLRELSSFCHLFSPAKKTVQPSRRFDSSYLYVTRRPWDDKAIIFINHRSLCLWSSMPYDCAPSIRLHTRAYNIILNVRTCFVRNTIGYPQTFCS